MGEQGFEIAIAIDQFGGGLDADAGDPGNIVCAVAAQGLNFDHLVGSDPKFLTDFRLADRPIRHRIAHHDAAVRDKLHHVLIGGQNRHLGAGLDGMARIGRDQIVGLEILHLDLAHTESLRGPTHMLQLRREIVRHLAAVRLVLAVHLVAEAAARRIEDHRNVVGVGLPQVFVQHVAEDHDDLGRHAASRPKPFGFGVFRPREIGAEDEARAVDQKHMMRQR